MIHRKLKVRKFLNLASYAVTFLCNNVISWPRLLAGDDLSRYRKVLVLAPHPDDEVFGMGGTLSLMKGKGLTLQIVWFTCGDNALRIGESMAVLENLGILHSAPSAFPVVGPSVPFRKSVAVIREALISSDPDLICVPSVFDPHLDHVRLNLALQRAIVTVPWRGAVLQYEVWNSLVPNVLVDISTVIEEKKTLMNLYPSQLDEPKRRYSERMVALNHYRGLANQVDYAEGFILAPVADYLELAGNSRIAEGGAKVD